MSNLWMFGAAFAGVLWLYLKVQDVIRELTEVNQKAKIKINEDNLIKQEVKVTGLEEAAKRSNDDYEKLKHSDANLGSCTDDASKRNGGC